MSAIEERILECSYGAFAAYYDEFTADHDYETWTSVVEQLAREHGLRGRSVLDVGCGTGKSFLPFARRGYRTAGCDLSAPMLRIARAKCRAEGLAVGLWLADVRRLAPHVSGAELVTCLDDVLNYQLDPASLQAAVSSLVGQLRAGGVLVFDANTECIYEESFLQPREREAATATLRWRARRVAHGLYEARIDVRGERERLVSVHRQAHHPRAEVESALAAAGASSWSVYGMDFTGAVDPRADERRHTKFLYIVNGSRR
jgi:SAM-dependent methyltransferase